MLSFCPCSLTSSSGQSNVTLPNARAKSTAPPVDWEAKPPTPPIHTPTHTPVKCLGAFSLIFCSRQGHRANTSRAQVSMVKVCRAPGNLEAKHTDANKAAFRERLPGGEG